MNILVTGGAGYVGSIVTEGLLAKGYGVTVLDNLQQGFKGAVSTGAELVVGDIRNPDDLEKAFSLRRFEAVVHLAAETVVEFSMTDPARYFINNVTGGLALLDAMRHHDVGKFIFSSTAAIYGEPEQVPITEDHPKNPVNSYGTSKLMFEHILEWYGRAYGLKHVSFRYFNAAGASELLGENHRPETHLIPNVLKAGIGTQQSVSVFGNDYGTPDGSCIRDYVHVIDIAQAHILALQKVDELSGRVYNLGSGEGLSVLEIIEIARKVTGRDIHVQIAQRRAGDPAVLVATNSLAKSELGWKPLYLEAEAIIRTAWEWMQAHPKGYEE